MIHGFYFLVTNADNLYRKYFYNIRTVHVLGLRTLYFLTIITCIWLIVLYNIIKYGTFRSNGMYNITLTAHGGQRIDQTIQQHVLIVRFVCDVSVQNIYVQIRLRRKKNKLTKLQQTIIMAIDRTYILLY